MTANVQVFGRRDCETIGAPLRPATEKRQGTKSREVGHWRRNGRYGDLMSAPLSMVGATRARGDVCIPGNRRECGGHLGGRVKCSNRRLVN